MAPQPPHRPENPRVNIVTSRGTFVCELFPKEAPNTTANFLRYVREGFYPGLIFHRVIKGFMIQGGGLGPDGRQKRATAPPIRLEVSPALIHWDGALAMARTSDPNSATTQFYVCHGPQKSLDGKYAVFGVAVEGLDVVHTIAASRTDAEDRPREDVVIRSMEVVAAPSQV